MTELTTTLYEFITHHYTAGIYNDPDYERALSYAETKEKQLKSQMDEHQRKLFKEFLDELHLAHHFEREYIFQATLALSRELSGLLRP